MPYPRATDLRPSPTQSDLAPADAAALDAVFDYRAYLVHVDESSRRIGLLPR